jgi:hypothetical protein
MREQETAYQAGGRCRQDVENELTRQASDQCLVVSHDHSSIPVFFKRLVEFQTDVIGVLWPGARNFCGRLTDFRGKKGN